MFDMYVNILCDKVGLLLVLATSTSFSSRHLDSNNPECPFDTLRLNVFVRLCVETYITF